ncbi:MAG TPA: ATP-binding protein, partial [Fimbriimonadaceae bacterium]|nr:ATP-binding protein [Fimbriimonadaceae bacterium]
ESQSAYFLPSRYASTSECDLRPRPDLFTEWEWHWDAMHEFYRYPYNGWFEISWRDQELQLVSIGRQEGHCRTTRHYVLAPDQSVAEQFFNEVCQWNAEVRGEVLVFEGGYWDKSSDLYESIQSASFDNLVLAGDLKTEIQTDIAGFFESKEIYQRYGIAWKRGVIFVGPPGNGKTHAVKSVINSVGKPCLYVKSFVAEYRTDQDNIGQVFSRAREAAPCILVLEDLDSLITSANRSFFLNEMDGFAANDGILTLATSNHPERLDPAILERPSRFDRKYAFDLPAVQEREIYLRLFSSKLQPELQMSEDGIQRTANSTDGYSFAYLKELYLASMMKWIAKPGEQAIDEIIVSQSESLRGQMNTESEMPEDISLDGAHIDPRMAAAMRVSMGMMSRGWRS